MQTPKIIGGSCPILGTAPNFGLLMVDTHAIGNKKLSNDRFIRYVQYKVKGEHVYLRLRSGLAS